MEGNLRLARKRGGGVIYGLSYPSRIEKQDFFFCLFQSGKEDQTVKARILPVKSLAARVTAGGWRVGRERTYRNSYPSRIEKRDSFFLLAVVTEIHTHTQKGGARVLPF